MVKYGVLCFALSALTEGQRYVRPPHGPARQSGKRVA
jgi:hypothetical protein